MSHHIRSLSQKKSQDEEQLYLRIVLVCNVLMLNHHIKNVPKMVSVIVIASLHKNGTSVSKVIIER